MIEYVRAVLDSQFVAALRMVKDAVAACPAGRWGEAVGTRPFGGVAYHALFFTDLYLSPTADAFAVGEVHRAGGDLRQCGFGPGLAPDQTLAYADQVGGKAAAAVAGETAESLRGPCGFPWLKISRGELHVYNLRHVQHHVGALGAFVRRYGVGGEGPDPMEWIDNGDWPNPPR